MCELMWILCVHDGLACVLGYCCIPNVNLLFLVAEVVPMLGTVLSRMIPMLGACKQENMQWVFAYGESFSH